MSNAPEEIIVRDHTALRDRPRRIWTFGGFNLPGIPLPPLGAFAAGFVVSFVLSLLLMQLPGLGSLILIFVIVDFVVGVVTAVWWSRFSTDDLKPQQWLAIKYDYLVRQPKRITGLGKDSEPDSLTLHVVMWEPESRWHDEVNMLSRAYLVEEHEQLASVASV